MTVGRNDPCPCGSGRKFKKCCMQKNNVVQLQEFIIERFYQQKNMLVDRLNDFIHERISQSLYYRLESQFKTRAKLKASAEQRGLFDFWIYFFYRHENGMRGIEWFIKENGHRLSLEERLMAIRWSELKPKLIQAIDKKESHILFRDFFTKETYQVSTYQENIPFFTPWYSTIALLEPVEGQYYFNGVRSLASPKGFQNAINLVQRLMTQTEMSHDQVLIEYFPELLVSLRDDKEDEDSREKEYVQYIYKFMLKDKVRGENFLYNEENFTILTWEETNKKLDWIDNIQTYTDSELKGQVKVAEVLASLELNNNTLTFTSYSLEIVNQFLKKLARTQGSFQLVDDQEERITLPMQADVKQMTASMEKGIPEYFVLYAQSNWIATIDEPIPMYDNLSLRELVGKGKADLADLWLKQSEFNIYKIVYQQFGKVEITADFNTVRRELGLELSPFVTGGEQRHSELIPLSETKQRNLVVLEEDIPIYKKLGFSPETIDNFYTKDIIAFYKEKAYGKSEGTERKYRYSLYDIREVLEKNSVNNWDECDLFFWKAFLSIDFFKINNNRVNKTMVKDMITTVKALTKWLEKEHKLENAKQFAELAKEIEQQMLSEVH
jgi:hypothetical protein